jgi:hypothetical protein
MPAGCQKNPPAFIVMETEAPLVRLLPTACFFDDLLHVPPMSLN